MNNPSFHLPQTFEYCIIIQTLERGELLKIFQTINFIRIIDPKRINKGSKYQQSELEMLGLLQI